jgi:hypothetical protein
LTFQNEIYSPELVHVCSLHWDHMRTYSSNSNNMTYGDEPLFNV